MGTAQQGNTPNVVIQDPNARSAVNTTLAIVGLVLGTAIVVDAASPEIDLASWVTPIFAGYAYIASAFGLAVTKPNYPKA